MKMSLVVTKFDLPIDKRFWNKVDKKDEDECWNWLSSKNEEGYGQFKYDDKMIKSHRFAYILCHGKISDNMFVLHSCDNPSCCNPKHLYLGSQKDNMEDMVNKGRQCKLTGENHGRAILKNVEVNEIRKLYNTRKYSQKQLSFMYKISQGVISEIINNKIWKDKKYEPINITGKEGELSWSSKLTWDKVNDIREKYFKYGFRTCQLCKEYNVSDGAIYKIIHNISWVDINYNPTLILQNRDDEIKEKYNKFNVSMIDLSKEFNIGISTINGIINNKED